MDNVLDKECKGHSLEFSILNRSFINQQFRQVWEGKQKTLLFSLQVRVVHLFR